MRLDVSGGYWYGIELPCGTVDAQVTEEPHATSFVNYLRIAFRAKGFPGIQNQPTCLEKLDVDFVEF